MLNLLVKFLQNEERIKHCGNRRAGFRASAMQHSCDILFSIALSVQACAKVVPVAFFLMKEPGLTEVHSRAHHTLGRVHSAHFSNKCVLSALPLFAWCLHFHTRLYFDMLVCLNNAGELFFFFFEVFHQFQVDYKYYAEVAATFSLRAQPRCLLLCAMNGGAVQCFSLKK